MKYNIDSLFKAMRKRLSIEDLRVLCFYLRGDKRLEDLMYKELSAYLQQEIIELIYMCERRNALDALVIALQAEFPFVLKDVPAEEIVQTELVAAQNSDMPIQEVGKRPGGEIARRQLHFIWIVDCSYSMAVDGRIQQLNYAIEEALSHLRATADENPFAEMLMQVIKFSSGAQWLSAHPIPIESFYWTNLTAAGARDMGEALSMVAERLKVPPMPNRGLPPVLVLIAAGKPTDDFARGLKSLMGVAWGMKATRIAIAIGADADLDVLQKFIGNPEIKPLSSNNPEAIAGYIRWVSTSVLPTPSMSDHADDVW
jgi:uncharacterized protein YegL